MFEQIFENAKKSPEPGPSDYFYTHSNSFDDKRSSRGFTMGRKTKTQISLVPGPCSYEILNDIVLSPHRKSPVPVITSAKRET